MFFRRLIPFARTARPYWGASVRGRKDLPIWRKGQSLSDHPFFRRSSFWNDPWFRDFGGPPFGSRTIDEYIREHMRRMNEFFKFSPWRIVEAEGSEAHGRGISAEIIQAKLGKDGLHLELNVSQFHPEELKVNTEGDRLIISGKHSSKPDEHGFVAREFTREFLIPEEVDQDTFTSRLTDDGHLVISATVKGDAATGRNITIEREFGDKREEKQDKE